MVLEDLLADWTKTLGNDIKDSPAEIPGTVLGPRGDTHPLLTVDNPFIRLQCAGD